MRIPFVGPSGEARSLNQNAERTVNCYLEKNPSPGREWALYGTPGAKYYVSLPGGLGQGSRGCIRKRDLTFWVIGDVVYKMAADGSFGSLGSIGTTSGRVGMACNEEEVLIVDGQSGWIATNTTLTEIADVDFPAGVTVALYLDGYFIVLGDDTQRLFWNETPGNGSAWNGLDFASAEGNTDFLIGGVVEGRNLWLFGVESTELWRNTGDAAQPFQRMDGVFIEKGIVSAWTAAKMDNGVFWLGRGENGDGIVFRSNGSSPQRVSTHALEAAIAGYSDISDAFAFCMEWEGHSWYVLTFPTADATWVYDAASDSWFEWLWRDPATNELHRHRAACHVFANRKHMLGDWEDGRVYFLASDAYTDDGNDFGRVGVPILRLRRTQTITSGGERLFFGPLTVDIETGVGNAEAPNPLLMLRYSNDGHTWSNEKTRSIGAVGEYGKQVKFGPSGAGRNRVWEVSMTDPVKFALFGADVEVSK